LVPSSLRFELVEQLHSRSNSAHFCCMHVNTYPKATRSHVHVRTHMCTNTITCTHTHTHTRVHNVCAQGRIVPCDFIGIVRSQQSVYLKGEIVSNHDELMSNFFAQVCVYLHVLVVRSSSMWYGE